jgi:hypothetical protein
MRAKFMMFQALSTLVLWNCDSRPQVDHKLEPGPAPDANGEVTEIEPEQNITGQATEVQPEATVPIPVYQLNFDKLPAGKRYRINGLSVEAACGPDESSCLKVEYVPNQRGSPVLQFRDALPPAREYTLSYSVKFDKDFDFARGGKLPGFAPEKHTTGCRPIEADGWSSRLMWRSEGALEIYSYDQNRASRCGEEYQAKGFRFERDRYYRVTQHLKLNAPADQINGYSSLYVDGILVARSEKLQYRKVDSPDTLIKYFFFSTFFGGDDDSWSPNDTVHAYFDDFIVYSGFYLEAAKKTQDYSNLLFSGDHPCAGAEGSC